MDLSNNDLSRVPTNCLSPVAAGSLVELDLSGNSIPAVSIADWVQRFRVTIALNFVLVWKYGSLLTEILVVLILLTACFIFIIVYIIVHEYETQNLSLHKINALCESFINQVVDCQCVRSFANVLSYPCMCCQNPEQGEYWPEESDYNDEYMYHTARRDHTRVYHQKKQYPQNILYKVDSSLVFFALYFLTINFSFAPHLDYYMVLGGTIIV